MITWPLQPQGPTMAAPPTCWSRRSSNATKMGKRMILRSINQYTQFPAGDSKHVIEAASRLYDLELTRPVVISPQDTEPHTYWDR